MSGNSGGESFGVHRALTALGGRDLLLDDRHCAVTAQEVGVGSVDIASLGVDNVSDELVRGLKSLPEKAVHNGVESFLEEREPAELLFLKELVENADQFIVDHLHTFQTGFLKTFDLLLDENFECRGANKERWLRTL